MREGLFCEKRTHLVQRGTNDTHDYTQGRMSATIVPWPERALKLRIEVNTSLVIKLGPWTVYGTSILFMP